MGGIFLLLKLPGIFWGVNLVNLKEPYNGTVTPRLLGGRCWVREGSVQAVTLPIKNFVTYRRS